MFFYEGAFHTSWLVKYAAAFFNISRSDSVLLNSDFNYRFSFSNALYLAFILLFDDWVEFAFSCIALLIQLYNVFLLILSSFDIIALDHSDDNANLTASALNSAVYFVRFYTLFSFQFYSIYCPAN